MGGSKPWPQAAVTNKDFTSATTVIIGAGFSGICVAIDLIRRNKTRNFIIVEKGGGVGGTWRDNKYPGCCCDIHSMLYSYSFEQSSDWTRLYPGQEEILDYLTRVAEKYSLYQHIRFNTTVQSASWDDETQKWKTRVKVEGAKDSEYVSDYTITSEFLVAGAGQLNAPRWPDIRGIDEFQGKKMHSARWDWTYPLEGKRIGIIGTGATATQIIPELVKVAFKLTVYQRSPSWVVPRQDINVPPTIRTLLKYTPWAQSRIRAWMMDSREDLHQFIAKPHLDTAQWMENMCHKQLQDVFPDRPDMREKLTPNFAIGCKRLLISDDLYPALAQDNCVLETRGIDRITPQGIRLVDGSEEEFDLLIFATGFRTQEFMYPIEITGYQGRPLSEVWQGGARALRGVTVEDMPNFGIMYGPNTNLGHSSIILMIEAQSRYLNGMMRAVLEAKQRGQSLSFRPKVEKVDAYDQQTQGALKSTAFGDPNCQSWYKNADGRITNNWPETVVKYQKDLEEVRWDEYDIEGEGKSLVDGTLVTRVGRVHEETYISNKTLLLGAVSVAATTGAVLLGRGSNLSRRIKLR